eukprot:gene56581-77537_t
MSRATIGPDNSCVLSERDPAPVKRQGGLWSISSARLSSRGHGGHDNDGDDRDESADLTRLVRSPVFGAEVQAQALAAVLDKAGIGGISAKFLKLLTANRRLFAVSDVIRAFRALVAKFKGEATADVTVAEPLSDNNLDALKAALKSVTGKDVALGRHFEALLDFFAQGRVHFS